MLGFLRWIWGLQLMLQWILITVIPCVQSPPQSSSPSNQSPPQFSSGQFEFVTYVPISEEEYRKMKKNIKCEDLDHFPTFALHPEKKKTILGCFKEISVVGNKCLEYNFKQNQILLQPKLNAPCGNFTIKPCNFSYSSLESYKILECFLIYGGIPSLLEQGKLIDYLEEKEKNMTQTREQENEESQKNITNLMQQVEKLNKKIDGLMICIGFLGGFSSMLIICIITISMIRLKKDKSNIYFEKNETKVKDTPTTDSCHKHDKATERDPLSEDFDTDGKQNHASEQFTVNPMNDLTPESQDDDVSTYSRGAELCGSTVTRQFNYTATKRLDENLENQYHTLDTIHTEIDIE